MIGAEKIKSKLLLASVQEDFNAASMCTIWSTRGQTHLADALTKGNQAIAKISNTVLVSGSHSNPLTSYGINSDVLGPTVSQANLDFNKVERSADKNNLDEAIDVIDASGEVLDDDKVLSEPRL